MRGLLGIGLALLLEDLAAEEGCLGGEGPGRLLGQQLAERGGAHWQKVRIVDQKGFTHILLYRMMMTDAGWRIGGVQILEAPGATA